MTDLIISVYGSHNAAVAMYYKGEYYVVEVERWLNVKNSGLVSYIPATNPQAVFDEITDWLLSKTNGEIVDVFLSGYADSIVPKFEYNKKIVYDHHTSHAATAFYQSAFDEMLIFTFDGGGDGAFFNVYKGSRKDGLKLICKYNYDLGFPYMVLAEILDDIRRDPLYIGNLVYAGKLMGLCAYGNVREEWIKHFDDFYSKFFYDGVSYLGGTQIMKDAMIELMRNIGVEDYVYNESRYTGQLAWDIAATSQRAFENMFFKLAGKYIEENPELPIGMAGGCALNVLLNTKLAIMKNGQVFIPPNVNDCGIAVGAIMWFLNPQSQVDLTYSGIPILDENMFSAYVQNHNMIVQDGVTITELAGYIAEGHIVGLIQGNSEHGSRALGNRSILCSPVGDMKDVINFKVKKREWYRPFAPVVHLEDVNKYFDFDYESRHMTYAPLIKKEFRDKIPAVTHNDGTGRLQTVTRQQNEFLYDLIAETKKLTGIGVLLNTSFNVNGKPILSSLSDAFNLLSNSSMDAIFYKNKLIFKQGEDKAFSDIRDSGCLNVIPLNPKINIPTICLIHNGKYDKKLIKYISEIKKEYDSIMLVSSKEICETVRNKIPEIKTYHITKSRYYHYDRFIDKIKEEDIPNRLKLIWLREVAQKQFKIMNVIAAVDITSDIDVNSLLKSISSANKKFLKNTSSYVHDNQTYQTGFGVIIGKSDSIISLVNKTESILIQQLTDGTMTATDAEMINLIKRK